MKPRVFPGSSARQEKLLRKVTGGYQDIADDDAWTTVFYPGASTLNLLAELTRRVNIVFEGCAFRWRQPPIGGLP
jgi:hypothetical protein